MDPDDDDLTYYWGLYDGTWHHFYQFLIMPKCAMAALAYGAYLEDQEGVTDAEEWVLQCMNFGLFEMRE
jgi:hypothetical protein